MRPSVLPASDGAAAPPRSNGELVFEEPWESRAFGIVMTLIDRDVFTWKQFQAALIARIARWQDTPGDGGPWSYYRHWLAALEDVLGACGCLRPEDVAARSASLARRPSGHDHTH